MLQPATIWIEVPLPPKDLSPNAHRHWRRRHTASRIYKTECAFCFAGIGPLAPPITIHLEFYCGRGQATFDRARRRDRYFPRDKFNASASAKYLVDALIVAGVVPDDSAKYVNVGRTELYTKVEDHHNRACVMVGLESMVDVDEPTGEWVDELEER